MTINLDTPLILPCGAVLSNRLCKAALSEGLADGDNRADERLINLYRQWSEGGAGLVITGNVLIGYDHLERPGNLVCAGPEHEASLACLAEAGTVAGNHIWMQINHTGRQTPRVLNPSPIAPSAVELVGMGDAFAMPREATLQDIANIIEDFARVADTARRTGFTGIQIHAAHGYLISQFLSPIANHRSDKWGGSLENRARLLIEITRATRARVGADFPVSVKLNSADFQKGGFSWEESLQVVRWLGEEGVDMLELSGGTYEQPAMIKGAVDDGTRQPPRDSTIRREAYFLQYAAQVKPVARMPVMVTGGFRTIAGMLAALNSGEADLIGLGRPLCIDPAWASKLLVNRDGSEPLGGLAPPDADPSLPVPYSVAEHAWYAMQLINRAQGHPVNPDLQLLDAVSGYIAHEASAGLAMRRRSPQGA